jgi:omega-6 fatty acid desaturase / acyl-lipid omega-6 desaturase (Delta-12 desaturase)
VEGDEVFVPPVSRAPGTAGRAAGDVASGWAGRALRTVPGRVAGIGAALTVGWPLYLAFNVSGRAYPKQDAARRFSLPPNHFDPGSPIFSKRQRAAVAASSALFFAVVAGLVGAARTHGFSAVAAFYGIPLLIVNAWLVIITLLQHSHPALPHYASSVEWDWLRGALATVDRSYGRILDAAFHHIADTHVLHHLFSGIPHYHAQEASEAIKPVLGDYYASDGRGVARALWEDWRDCHWVSPDAEGEAALWFRGDRD